MEANHIIFPSDDTFFKYQRHTEPHGGLFHRIVAAEWESQQAINYDESIKKLDATHSTHKKDKRRRRWRNKLYGVKLAGDGRYDNIS